MSKHICEMWLPGREQQFWIGSGGYKWNKKHSGVRAIFAVCCLLSHACAGTMIHTAHVHDDTHSTCRLCTHTAHVQHDTRGTCTSHARHTAQDTHTRRCTPWRLQKAAQSFWRDAPRLVKILSLHLPLCVHTRQHGSLGKPTSQTLTLRVDVRTLVITHPHCTLVITHPHCTLVITHPHCTLVPTCHYSRAF